MTAPLLLLLALGPIPLPKECEPPELRDTAPLKELANLDSAFSASLDAVATWCFESGGTWNGGEKSKGGKTGVATGDCAHAISSCEEALATVKSKAAASELVGRALQDLDRPFHGLKYVPKRSGLMEHPSEAASCQSHSRSELFAMAQSRMDLARLAAVVQNEYQGYKNWLYTEGLKCRGAVASRGNDTQRVFAIDQPRDAGRDVVAVAPAQAELVAPPAKVDAGPGPSITVSAAPVAAAAPPASPAPSAPASPAEREAALKGPMLEKWKFLAREQAFLETDRDYTQGFLASRELRACDCTRVNAQAMARSIDQKEGGESGMALMRAEDQPNTRCTVCLLDAFPVWKQRADRQCALMAQLSDFEVDRLARSDDANGLPPRCFEETRKQRAALAASRPPIAAADAGRVVVAMLPPPASAAPPQSPAGGRPLPPMTYLLPKAAPAPAPLPGSPAPKSYYYKAPSEPVAAPSPPAPVAGPALGPPTGPGVAAGANADEFVPPTAWAPIPNREEGRLYVRLSMSAACVAEVLPGPMQARTGDLLLLPWNATQVTVKSPCGGLAEVYFGREAKPRHSEIFTKALPVRFEFKTQ